MTTTHDDDTLVQQIAEAACAGGAHAERDWEPPKALAYAVDPRLMVAACFPCQRSARAVLPLVEAQVAPLRDEVEQKEALLRTMDHFAEVAETSERKSNEWAEKVRAAESALRQVREDLTALADERHNHKSKDCPTCFWQTRIIDILDSGAWGSA